MNCKRLKPLTLASLVWALYFPMPARAQSDFDRETSYFNATKQTLDTFMKAGQSADIRTGSELLEEFRRRPQDARERTNFWFDINREIFDGYLCADSIIYSFVARRCSSGIKTILEGAIEYKSGRYRNYRALLIYERKRWRIQDIEFGLNLR